MKTCQRTINAGAIFSCFTSELEVIIDALDLYETLPILQQVKGLVLFYDSKVAIQAILNGSPWIKENICSHLSNIKALLPG
ncbi:hypothetical protein TNCV_3257521 [Trichonephila clavipes]|nr:hypothetical protein TNCV_3257521 [Trichonephila clavipes]